MGDEEGGHSFAEGYGRHVGVRIVDFVSEEGKGGDEEDGEMSGPEGHRFDDQ